MIAKWYKYHYVLKTSIMDTFVYVVDFFGRSVFFAFILGIYLLLWQAVYGATDSQMIEGFDLNRMIWYLVITEIVTLSTSNYYDEVSTDIKTGNIAYQLNKPYHYVTYSFYNNFGKVLIRMLVNSTVGILTALVFVGGLESFHLYSVPFVLLSLFMGIGINFFLNFTLALTAFWVEENTPFRWIFQKLVFTLGGMLLPLDLFPHAIQNISRYLPFAYITYVPGKLFVDFNTHDFLYGFMGQCIYLILAILLCYAVYKKGVKALNVNGG